MSKAFLTLMAVALSGCATTGDRPPEGANDAAPAAVVKVIKAFRFTPDTVTISVGQTVEWDNTGLVHHTVTADPSKAADPQHVQLPAGAEPFDSGNLSPGQTFRHTFTVPGTYRYVCLPHEKMGMVGEVIVKP